MVESMVGYILSGNIIFIISVALAVLALAVLALRSMGTFLTERYLARRAKQRRMAEPETHGDLGGWPPGIEGKAE